MTAADDLGRAITVPVLDDIVEGADTTFSIDTLDKAVWAVRKIGQHRRRFAEANHAAAAERSRIDCWIEDERKRLDQSTSHLEALLRRYHEAQLAEDPKRRTIRTPAGDLVAHKSPDSLTVDETVFVPWAEAGADDLLNPPKARTPNKRAIRQRVGEIMVDGTVVDGDTGAFLPGVMHVDGEISFKVVTDEAVKP